LAALASGLTQKQACKSVGIGQTTLIDWRKEYPELDPQMESAREVARQTALEGIKTAGEKDWRALAEWLKLTFPEYRSGSNINVSATAVNDNRTVVVTEEKRKQLQAQLKEIQDSSE
jgi:DNA-binding XRE family transcriptional regulator